jgi:hypothetical protein
LVEGQNDGKGRACQSTKSENGLPSPFFLIQALLHAKQLEILLGQIPPEQIGIGRGSMIPGEVVAKYFHHIRVKTESYRQLVECRFESTEERFTRKILHADLSPPACQALGGLQGFFYEMAGQGLFDLSNGPLSRAFCFCGLVRG